MLARIRGAVGMDRGANGGGMLKLRAESNGRKVGVVWWRRVRGRRGLEEEEEEEEEEVEGEVRRRWRKKGRREEDDAVSS
jgi:hypothetical protein